MSTVIIIGGSGHNSVTRLIVIYPRATADQQARIKALIETFTDEANKIADEVDKNRL